MPDRSGQFPELLAPAGGGDALRAAVANGADAVYLGVESLNARRGAENFTLDSLAAACDFTHLRDRKVYLTANTLVLPDETGRALELIDAAWAAGVDAVIVQDLGLLRLIRRTLPAVRVHASTQLDTLSGATVTTLADLGISRVTLAREMSLEQIAAAVDAGRAADVEVEAFVHGALCVCFSGQCLLSSMVGGRSANRGMCAQPCRLTYELVAEGCVLQVPGAHLLSPKDLAGIGVLPQLVATGVAALKIEGRMKSPEYVAAVTGVYRAALDRAVADPDSYAVTDGEMAVLNEAFSRGFSEAYLVGERGNDMMSYSRPNNRGVPVGRIIGTAGDGVTLALDRPLDSQDTIEVWTGSGRFAQQAGPLEYDGRPHAFAPAGAKPIVRLERSARTGDRVFRVRNAALYAAAERTYANGSEALSIPLRFAVDAVIGQPLAVRVSDGRSRSGEATGVVVEAARTRAVTVDDVIEHVGRLGNTPYVADAWDVTLSPGAGLGFSALHNVRRDALAAYEQGVLRPWREREVVRPIVERVRRRPRAGERPRVVAVVASMDGAMEALAAGADEVHVAAAAARDSEPVSRVVPVLSRASHDVELSAELAVAIRWGRAVAGTLGALHDSVAGGCATQAHWALNAANASAADQLGEMGATHVWLSPELTIEQVVAIAAETDAPVGVAVAGRTEVMVTQHCVLMAEGECSRLCGRCPRRQRDAVLRDRRGYEFPVVTDENGVSHVYNSVPLDVTHALPELIAAGVAAVRVDLETMAPQRVAAEVGRVRAAVEQAMSGAAPQRVPDTTTGHFFRGVS